MGSDDHSERDHSERLIHGLRTGDEEVIADFLECYGARLMAVADRNIASGMRRRVGPESVMQSAFRTFFRRAEEGQFELPDSAALWQLLCAITVTKAREQVRFHLRQKRGIHREVDDQSATVKRGIDDAPAPQPTPAEAAVLADHFEALLGSLDEEEQQIVNLKLQDCTNLEVADQLGCSDRTVTRILTRIRDRLEPMLSA